MDILIQQEIELHQYEVRQNNNDIKRLIHPDFSEVGRGGDSYDFMSIVKMMRAEEPSTSKIHSQNYECLLLSPSVHLLKYQTALVSELGDVSNYAKRCSIWVLTEAGWQLKYHQGTPCLPFELTYS